MDTTFVPKKKVPWGPMGLARALATCMINTSPSTGQPSFHRNRRARIRRTPPPAVESFVKTVRNRGGTSKDLRPLADHLRLWPVVQGLVFHELSPDFSTGGPEINVLKKGQKGP